MAIGPRVKVEIAEKRFAVLPQPLFAGLSIEVSAGSVVALVGASGVGKSSLLRMIAGIDNDYSGTISIDGIAAAEAPPAGFVFQDSRLLPWLSAIDNVLAVRAATGRTEAARWLSRVGLAGYEDALPQELSGGMQRRVALARALSVNSRLLLLDEPFVSLDRHLIGDLQALVLELIGAEGATAIMVTHLPEDAARLANRAIVLDGRPARILADLTFDVPLATRSAADVLRLSEELAGAAGR
jgi:NitT/TauT family transport system ATP-binding protein/sulfonate transport system ATP-binding protein